ncbi:MAG: hypothetical protein JW751_12175 [Polyangiaceae bacterium]|nr:hypothetical protein [Polyangiaceae bacterium]
MVRAEDEERDDGNPDDGDGCDELFYLNDGGDSPKWAYLGPTRRRKNRFRRDPPSTGAWLWL